MNAHDVLHYGHTCVTRNLDDLPMSEWETEHVCGWWSTKNLIAHLASFEYVLIDGTIVTTHQKASGAKGGLRIRRSGGRAAD